MMETEILGWHMTIVGFRNVRIKNIDAFFDLVKKGTEGCHVQFFDARIIAGFDHLYFAALNALKAFETGLNISKNLALDVLLFASGQNQIKEAVELLGIKPDSFQIAVLILADTRFKVSKALNYVSDLLQAEIGDEVIELTDGKVETIKRAFGITDLEIEATLRRTEKEALISLLTERAALLVTQR